VFFWVLIPCVDARCRHPFPSFDCHRRPAFTTGRPPFRRCRVAARQTFNYASSIAAASVLPTCADGPRTPFERVKACPQADRERVARLEQLRKSLDPFQLGEIIERKLARISRLANRRQSPRAEQQREAKTSQQMRRRKGCGKDARSASLGIATRFPLSHSRNNHKVSVTFQMS